MLPFTILLSESKYCISIIKTQSSHGETPQTPERYYKHGNRHLSSLRNHLIISQSPLCVISEGTWCNELLWSLINYTTGDSGFTINKTHAANMLTANSERPDQKNSIFCENAMIKTKTKVIKLKENKLNKPNSC